MAEHVDQPPVEQFLSPAGDGLREHDWTKEAWVQEISALTAYIGMHIAVAMVAEPVAAPGQPPPTPQQIEDMLVYTLLRPDITEQVFLNPKAPEYVRYRVAHAISQAIEKITKKWAAERGPGSAAVRARPGT